MIYLFEGLFILGNGISILITGYAAKWLRHIP